jgi:hypothetical protein
MHREIDGALDEGDVELLREQPLAARFRQRRSWIASPVVLMTLNGICSTLQPSAAARRSWVSCACASASGDPRVPITRVAGSAIVVLLIGIACGLLAPRAGL